MTIPAWLNTAALDQGINFSQVLQEALKDTRLDTFYDFKGKKLTAEILDELNHQFLCLLKKEGLVTLKKFFIDGSKIEANWYTFVLRWSLNYHPVGLLNAIDTLYAAYHAFLHDNGYGPKYDLGDAHMFFIDGMEKVRHVIEENRKSRGFMKSCRNAAGA